jgi:hypothetical protein
VPAQFDLIIVLNRINLIGKDLLIAHIPIGQHDVDKGGEGQEFDCAGCHFLVIGGRLSVEVEDDTALRDIDHNKVPEADEEHNGHSRSEGQAYEYSVEDGTLSVMDLVFWPAICINEELNASGLSLLASAAISMFLVGFQRPSNDKLYQRHKGSYE